MITIDKLEKSFGGTKALDGLSFEVRPGEVVGFLGPNGAGKSTTMRIMTGYLSPDRGSITIDGINVAEDPIRAQRLIGYLPENNPLYKDMLVAELMELSAELREIPKEDRRKAFDVAVKAAGIDEVYYRPVNELSKGYRQRLGIALALLGSPSILILDEPTEGLDPNQRTEIRALIKSLAKDRTVIMSTHVMQEASAVCDRLVIISKGKIVADGKTAELIRATGGQQALTVDLEGAGVAATLRALPGVKNLEVLEQTGARLKAHLHADGTSDLRPALSKAAHQHDWIIWKLAEDERGLEDVFRQLTTGL
jgi:ABC-2 type transport system ATP-binding protein